MFAKPKNRYSAFGIHLLISALIFIVLSAIIIFVWYPGFLFHYDGGWQGVRLIAGVDFIIGPVLTLIVYNVKKPELNRDLLVIALIQISALAYGSWLVYQERPIAVAYADGKIRSISNGMFLDEELEAARDRLHELGSEPVWVYVNLPQDETNRRKARANQIVSGTFHTRSKLYESFKENIDKIQPEALQKEGNEKYRETFEKVGENLLYPFTSRYAFGLLELDAITMDYIESHNVTYGQTLQ